MIHQRQIINIRGANASGKTTLARAFVDPMSEAPLGEFTDAEGKPQIVRYYTRHVEGLQLPIHVLGTYDDSKYSGMDKVKSADIIDAAVTYAAASLPGHVLFEGFRVSKSWTRYAELRNRLNHQIPHLSWLWVFMHAPLDLIYERVDARRNEGSRPTDRKELAHVVTQMNNTRIKARSAFPFDVLEMDPYQPPAALVTRLAEQLRRREVVGGSLHQPYLSSRQQPALATAGIAS